MVVLDWGDRIDKAFLVALTVLYLVFGVCAIGWLWVLLHVIVAAILVAKWRAKHRRAKTFDKRITPL